jgi:rhodanese-related sulfurtransferase
VLKLLCRVSLSPDTCVRQSGLSFQRWGVASLVLAKFVPGVSTVSPPVAGALGIRPSAFLLFNGVGSALWAGAGIAAGVLFGHQVDWAPARLTELGGFALALLLALLALYIAYRAWDRWRFVRALRMARVTVDELYELMSRGDPPVMLDVRSRAHREADGWRIPGARPVDLEDLERTIRDIPPGRDIIVYCACPNEASAVRVARLLAARGFRRVRPLAGGIDAWVAAGFALEALSGDDLGDAA